MKFLLLVACLLCFACACNNATGNPKDALGSFLAAMQDNNYEEAKKFATDDSQSFLNMLDKDGNQTNNVYKDKKYEITHVEATGDDAKATVQFKGNTSVNFHLKNEHGAWKVQFNLSAMMDMVKDLIKMKGVDIDKEVNQALDSIKINLDSLP